MTRYKHSKLTEKQQNELLGALERLKTEASFSLHTAKRDADDLRRFVHIMRALKFVSAEERNHYIREIDGIINEVEVECHEC